MIAPAKIRCRVIAIPVSGDFEPPRPSELVPWADPYIAQLVSQLQSEVRSERGNPLARRMNFPLGAFDFELSDDDLLDLEMFELDVFDLDGDILEADLSLDGDPSLDGELVSEAEWPWNDDQYEFEPVEDDRFRNPDDRRDDLPAIR
jgi:hypothetical protein